MDLLDIGPQHQGIRLGFIDEIVYGIKGKIRQEELCKLKLILNRAEDWRKKYEVQFETSKYTLVHFM